MARWKDEIRKFKGKQWTRVAHDRSGWRSVGEASTLPALDLSKLLIAMMKLNNGYFKLIVCGVLVIALLTQIVRHFDKIVYFVCIHLEGKGTNGITIKHYGEWAPFGEPKWICLQPPCIQSSLSCLWLPHRVIYYFHCAVVDWAGQHQNEEGTPCGKSHPVSNKPPD